jgi:glycosyltransferase involved in cell wall biosynthesis
MLGLFIKRHAETLTTSNSIAVLHVCFDTNASKSIEIEKETINNVFTVIVYCKKVKSRFFVISNIQKAFLSILAYYKGIKTVFHQFGRPDLIHIHVLTLRPGILAFFLKRRFKIPYFITEHSSYYLPQKKVSKGFLWETATKFLASKSQGISAVSECLKIAMINRGYTHLNFMVIRNIVPDIFFQAALPDNKSSGKIIFSNITCFDDSVKNISGIVRTIDALKNIRQDFELYLVGDGPDRLKIEQLVRTLNLEKYVKFTGLLEDIPLVEQYMISDFTVLFSYYETMAVVIAESLACGKPVIASNSGGMPELINENNGLLVDPGDENDLLEKILLMMNIYKHYNPVLIRNAAYNQFSKAVIAEKFEEFYTIGLQK